MLDYYIRLILPIFFTLLKINLDGNPEYDTIKNMRDIRYKNMTAGDLLPSLTQVLLYIN